MKQPVSAAILQVIIIFSLISVSPAGPDDSHWKELALMSTHGNIYLSTSELNSKGPHEFGPYGAHNLFDNNIKTCWAEGVKGHGIGQSIYIAIKKNLKSISIINGYTKNKMLFEKNSRVKKFNLSVFIGINEPGYVTETHTIYNAVQYKTQKNVLLQDSMKPQVIDFPFDMENLRAFKNKCVTQFIKMKNLSYKIKDLDVQYIINFQIADVYKGGKYDDTCVSEISFIY